MSDLPFFSFGVLALLAVWKYMLRPAIQDTFKDWLFDVRDKVRQQFAAHGQLDTVAYRELRDTLNGYIRFVEVATLSYTLRFAMQMAENPQVTERYRKELDRRFDVQIPALAALAKRSRRRCSRIIQLYVFHSSLLSLAMLYLAYVPMAIVHEVFKFCRDRALRSWKTLKVGVYNYVCAIEDITIEPKDAELISLFGILRFA